MSRDIDIFLETEDSLEDVVKELNELLGITLRLMINQGDTWYEAYVENIVITIGNHEYTNDENIQFEYYPYDISLKAYHRDANERVHLLDEYAEKIFTVLKNTQKYSLMLVEDVTVKYKEFHL